MIRVNILEQLQVFFDIIKNHPYLNYILLASGGCLLILLLANLFRNKKVTKILYTIVYSAIFGTLIYFFYGEIGSLLDYLMDNIFINLFFPNLAIYILILIIVNIVIIRSTFSNKIKLGTKIFNINCFVIFNVLFFLIVSNIITNKIDVYKQLDIYTNEELLTLIELNMTVFIIWLICLLIGKIIANINIYANRERASKEVVPNVNDNVLVIENDINKLPENDITKKEYIYVSEEADKNTVYNEFINEDIIPVKKKKNSIPTFENLDKTLIIENDIVANKDDAIISNEINSVAYENNSNLYSEYINNVDLGKENTNLSAYDIIFTSEEQEKLDENINHNMQIVFNSGDYLKSIIDDIQRLKTNRSDQNLVDNIVNNIVNNDGNLSLSEYNYLIDYLTTVRR